MLALLFAAVCSASVAPSADSLSTSTPACRASAQNPDGLPVKALNAWLKLYRRGKIEYRSEEPLGKESIAVRFKVRSKTDLGNPTWAGDLLLILKGAAAHNDARAARAMAEIASVGLDKGKYTYAMAPYRVRVAALEALGTMSSKETKEELAAGASGEWESRKYGDALRAAALLALGYIGDNDYEPVVEAALADGNPVIRIHAVQALQRLGDDKATLALIRIVERENDDGVLVMAAKALRTIYGKYLRDAQDKMDRDRIHNKPEPKDKPGEGDDATDKEKEDTADETAAPPASARLAVRAAIKALGRTTWRADMVLVRLLDDFRSAEAVPALISVLERFRDNPKDVASGKRSSLLQFKAHELLVSMTGAVYSAKQADRWRELWERDKDKIAVAQRKPASAKRSGATSAAGFVGIPVQGSRVAFILDLSGSMEWAMEDKGEKVRRLDYAKRELIKAIEGLSPNAMFNLVTFNGDDEAESWSKKLVVANKRNRERFKKFVKKLRPLGGTNLWSGMEKALGIKMLEYGNHYETTIDEIFLLSDGAPSVGDVIDPVEILRLVREVNRFKEVRINTVFISSATPPQVAARQREMSLTPKELMRRMAKQNGGKFRDV